MLVVYQSCRKKSGWHEETRSPDLPGSRGRSNQPFAESVAELSSVMSMTSLAAHDEEPPQELQTALGVRAPRGLDFSYECSTFSTAPTVLLEKIKD